MITHDDRMESYDKTKKIGNAVSGFLYLAIASVFSRFFHSFHHEAMAFALIFAVIAYFLAVWMNRVAYKYQIKGRT